MYVYEKSLEGELQNLKPEIKQKPKIPKPKPRKKWRVDWPPERNKIRI